MLAHQFGVIEVERTRMRFLLRDADLGQIVDQNFRFDFKLSRQFVDSYLIRV
jgi:hypothetical protein